jgi:D-alanyl-D-alanine carboxypeptidase
MPAAAGLGGTAQGTIIGLGHNFASRTGDQVRNWDGDLMLRENSASSRLVSSRLMRAGFFGLVALTAAAITTDSAHARRYYRHHVSHARHHDSGDSYSPRYSAIIVDGNSGTTLTATDPDGIRHPASLTKIMTLYLLFERLDSGKMKLDTEMAVSEHAADQDPTKLDLRPGSTIKVEDAIKGLITRSANDAAVVIAEAIGGSEDEFAKLMTRKARALGMSRTVYRNANGLPNDEQVTTARDQATLGRAIQDRFPRYYRYFSTTSFTFRGQNIRNHNHLLGSVDGVDGIKTGYTRSSGFNLVTSMHRGNRFLVGVVMGGRSGGSRDAIMRGLLAENLSKAATTRTAAAITERNSGDAPIQVAEAAPQPKPAPAQQDAAVSPDTWTPPAMRTPPASKVTAALAEATAAVPPAQPRLEQKAEAKIEPAPLTAGVIQTQPIGTVPGSSEPMKPVKVKTVHVKAGAMKLASAGPSQPAPAIIAGAPQPIVPETSSAVVAKAAEATRPEPARSEASRIEAARAEMPMQPAGHGTGNGVLGVLPAATASAPQPPAPQPVAVASAAPQPLPAAAQPAAQAPQTMPPVAAVKVHTGWIVQVGALETEAEAQARIDAARNSSRGLLTKADSFTEPVVAKDNRKLFRARFAGLERDQAEAVCRTLRRSDIACMAVRN